MSDSFFLNCQQTKVLLVLTAHYTHWDSKRKTYDFFLNKDKKRQPYNYEYIMHKIHKKKNKNYYYKYNFLTVRKNP